MKSSLEWKKWGEMDPLFAVSSWAGKEKGGKNPWTDDEFYELGRSDCENFMPVWKSFGYDRSHCLEIGSGAGRLTRHLAEYFECITATDVSEHQLQYAQTHIDRKNIRYLKINGVDIPLQSGSVSAVFSTHVFQHFDSQEDAGRVFQEISRVLKPGGTLMIHLPLYILPKYPVTPFLVGAISLSKKLGTLRANLHRKAGKLIMRGLVYDRAWLIDFLPTLGLRKMEFRAFTVSSNGDWHDFLLAQK